MAPVKRPAKVLKIHVPRHNAQRIGNKLNAQVKHLAREEAVLVDTYQTNPDLAAAAESASDWNSLLITARAQRGPQWDIGTQQFHVDKDSDLYYNPTSLLEVVKKELEDDAPDPQVQSAQHYHLAQQYPGHPGHPGNIPPHHMGQHPQGGFPHPGMRHQTPLRGGDPRGEFHNMPPGMHPQMVQGGGHGHPHAPPPGAQMNFSPGGFPGAPGMNMRQGFPNAPFNAMPPGQFFNNDPGASPMRGPPGHMGGMNMNVGMPGGGGMPGMGVMPQRVMPQGGMNISSEMRRMTRSMQDDFPTH